MAGRRMFSFKIVESDAFLEMPTSSRELYFHLGMHADDDGFVNPKRIMRMIGASDDDIKVLLGKRFVLSFENGVIVIKHWKINNLIRKDFYQPTIYQDEKALLLIKENGSYTENEQIVNKMLTNCSRSIGKVSIVKDRLGEIEIDTAIDTGKIDTDTKIDTGKIDTDTKIDTGKIDTDTKIDTITKIDIFDEVWNLYSHKVNISKAKKAWDKLSPSPDLQRIIKEDIQKRKLCDRQWLEGYQPHLSTYLNGKRWEDAITPPRNSNPILPTGTPQPKGKYDDEKVLIV